MLLLSERETLHLPSPQKEQFFYNVFMRALHILYLDNRSVADKTQQWRLNANLIHFRISDYRFTYNVLLLLFLPKLFAVTLLCCLKSRKKQQGKLDCGCWRWLALNGKPRGQRLLSPFDVPELSQSLPTLSKVILIPPGLVLHVVPQNP